MTKTAAPQSFRLTQEHKALSVFIGKWINEGVTIASPGTPVTKILTSDVYEWVPGEFFIVHSAYGRMGDKDVGGVEMIGFDKASGKYRTHFFDSGGNLSLGELTVRDGTWTWKEEKTRCTGTLSNNGKTLIAHHERSDDGVNWIPSMDVTLTKVE